MDAAADVYTVDLQPPPRDGLLRRMGRGVWTAASELAPGLVPPATVGHLVVTERATSREVLRVPADAHEAGVLLSHVREQLRRETPEEFRAAWSIPADPEPPAGASGPARP